MWVKMAWNVGVQTTWSMQIYLTVFKVECCKSFFFEEMLFNLLLSLCGICFHFLVN